MVIRKDVVRAAAMAALACGGLALGLSTSEARAGGGAPAASALNLPEFALEQPVYLAAAGAEEQKGRRPLMSVIDRTGMASMLDEWGIDVSGHVEASYTVSDSGPPDGGLHEDFITGR